MVVGHALLERAGITREQLTLAQFATVRDIWNEHQDELYAAAVIKIAEHLDEVVVEDASLQQLSAIFRRNDLVDPLIRPTLLDSPEDAVDDD